MLGGGLLDAADEQHPARASGAGVKSLQHTELMVIPHHDEVVQGQEPISSHSGDLQEA